MSNGTSAPAATKDAMTILTDMSMPSGKVVGSARVKLGYPRMRSDKQAAVVVRSRVKIKNKICFSK